MRLWLFSVLIMAVSAPMLCCDGVDTRDVSRIRVFNASPDAPNIDVTLGDDVMVENLAFGEGTGFFIVDAGAVRFLVEETAGGDVLLDETIMVDSGGSFTLAVFDFLDNLGTFLFLDDLELDNVSRAELRIINLSPSIGTVDVFVTPPDEDISTSSPDIFDLGLAEASENLLLPFLEEHRIRVTPANSKAVLADSGVIGFSVAQIRTVMIVDAPGGGEPFGLVFLADRG